MSPLFVIFCIIAFLIPVCLCIYYKHKVEEQRVELNALKEKKEQTANEFIHSMRYDSVARGRAWQALMSETVHIERPSKDHWKRMAVEFADGQMVLESFKMTDTYKGLLEGDPAYASEDYWYEAQQNYNREGHLLLKPTLVPSWARSRGQCLPHYKVEIELVDGVNHLRLCWFTSDVPQTSLAEFINAQTRSIDFSTHCKKYLDD